MTGRRTISPEELRKIVAEHERWLASEGKEGHRACLRSCDLSGAGLVNENLAQADLVEANLSSADLAGARLKDADLREANLNSADLTGATLEDADLTNTDLRHVKGLAADRLGGADLTGAKLPSHIAQFRSLDYVAEVSRNARVTFFTLLLVCAYAVLTILTTTDHRLITNSTSSPIPFSGTEAPIIWFYRIMPAVIVGIYVYLLLYLGRLWRRLPALPARLPDGTALTSTVYPWLLNEQIRQYMPRLRGHSRPLYRADIVFSNILAWFIPPATVVALWWRYLPRHDFAFTSIHIVLIFIALFLGTVLFALMVLTLRREVNPLRLYDAGKTKPFFAMARRRLLLAPSMVFFLFVIPVSAGVFYGDADRFERCVDGDSKAFQVLQDALHESGVEQIIATVLPLNPKEQGLVNLELCIRKAIPNLLKTVRYRSHADLRDQYVSQRPDTWSNEAEFFQAVRGADLGGRDLRYADARRAFLVKAILSWANLEKADLRGSDLRRARLINANLEGAHLEDAELDEAVLVGATLEGAFLDRAVLRKANLRVANLTEAELRGANLSGANLAGAKGLTRKQLETACGDENTIIPRGLWYHTLHPCSEQQSGRRLGAVSDSGSLPAPRGTRPRRSSPDEQSCQSSLRAKDRGQPEGRATKPYIAWELSFLSNVSHTLVR